MMKTPLWLPFLLGTVALFFFTSVFPSLRLFYFAPFLVIVLQRYSLFGCLVWGAICGLMLDLLGSVLPFGMQSLLTTICVAIGFRFRKWFFEENIFSHALYTILLSALMCIFEPTGLPLSLLMAPIDGLYAFLIFTCPILLYRSITSIWYTDSRRFSIDHKRNSYRSRNRAKS